MARKKIKAYTHIFKIAGISIVDKADGPESEGLELIALMKNSNVFESDTIHTMDFSRSFIEDHKIKPGHTMKVIIYGHEDAVIQNEDSIEIESNGHRIELFNDSEKNWTCLSEDLDFDRK